MVFGASATGLTSNTGEQAARGWPVLIGSALARSRGWHVRAMFGIEDFRGKLNGNGTI
jgi:hypothetical protein